MLSRRSFVFIAAAAVGSGCADGVSVEVVHRGDRNDVGAAERVVSSGFVDDDGRAVEGVNVDPVVDPVEPARNVFADVGLPADVAADAALALANARAAGLVDAPLFTVIDFALPSTERRLWLVDVDAGTVVVNDRVSHGSGSNSADDPAMAAHFSNTPGSLQSSLGLSRTAETYDGNNGYSLRLDGLEASNDNMRDRAIVMHGAAYAEDSFVDDNGYLGRSSGCPAVAMSRSADLIDLVKEGTLIFQWFPDDDWRSSSPFLQPVDAAN